jgi:hypothetical protein
MPMSKRFDEITQFSEFQAAAIESGRDLQLDPVRCYTDYRGMAQVEAPQTHSLAGSAAGECAGTHGAAEDVPFQRALW